MSTKYFTPEFRADANYILDYNHPKDDTIGGSTEIFRSNEVQLDQISFGGDLLHYDTIEVRLLDRRTKNASRRSGRNKRRLFSGDYQRVAD